MKEEKASLLTVLRVDLGQDGRMLVRAPMEEILRNVRDKGTLALTARTLGLSYTYLWTLLRELNRVVGEPLIETKRGGRSGGRATLTSRGRRLLESYELLREAVSGAVHKATIKEVALRDLVVIGSQCLGLSILLRVVKMRRPGFDPLVMHVGSSRGLEALRDGEADVAGVHLLDLETGGYNLPFLERFGLSKTAVLVRGYLRRQGLIVKRGNPMGVQGLKDLLLGDLPFINRNRGSGTRLLLDSELAKISRQRGVTFEGLIRRIRGYETEAMSSLEVAEAISHGRVDVGMGIEAEAVAHALDFIPVAEEQYDFVIRKERLDKKGVRLFLDALASDTFKELLGREAAGLRATNQTGMIVG